MAAKRRVAKAGATAYGAAQSRYVQRLIEDDELRANIVHAIESGKSAYERLTNGKSPTKTVFDDKRFQRDVREAGRAEVQAIGAGATNQAVKAVAIARDYLSETGIDAICIPAFIDVTIENEDRTAIRLVVEPR